MTAELVKHYLVNIITPSLLTTLHILFWEVVFTSIAGFILGTVLYATAADGLFPHPKFNLILGAFINVIRSIPVLIFMILMIPVVRAVVGTAIGEKAAIFNLSIACTPYMGRVIEGKLKLIDKKLIEAGQSMGLSNMQVLTRIVIHESIPSIVIGITFAAIVFIGGISMAGLIGAGGIGAIALSYGYQQYNDVVMYGCILILAALVCILQTIGRGLYHKLK